MTKNQDINKDALNKKLANWIKLLRKIDKQRQKNKYGILFDAKMFSLLENEIRFTHKTDTDIKLYFLDFYENFCRRIIDASRYEAGSGKIVDAISSVTKTIYALDKGYEIYSDIALGLPNIVLREHIEKGKQISQAFNILLQKRWALWMYLDPFGGLEVEDKLKQKWMSQGYSFIEACGYDNLIPKDEYLEQAKYVEDIVGIRKIVFYLLNSKKKAIILERVSDTDTTINLFARLADILPEAKIKNFKKEYGEQEIFVTGYILGQKIDIKTGYDTPNREYLNLINPIVEAKLNKTIVYLSGFLSFGEDILIVVDKNRAIEVKLHPLLQ